MLRLELIALVCRHKVVAKGKEWVEKQIKIKKKEDRADAEPVYAVERREIKEIIFFFFKKNNMGRNQKTSRGGGVVRKRKKSILKECVGRRGVWETGGEISDLNINITAFYMALSSARP